MAELRPMREDDVDSVHEMSMATFEDLERRLGSTPHPRPAASAVHPRYRRLIGSDPDGSWVAEDEHGLAGCALAIRREHLWGLSLLVVRPDAQSTGVGGALLRRANEYADGAAGRIILSSPDPRAMRAYARLGLDLHPSLDAKGVPRDVRMPAGIREGGLEDLPFTAEVDRHVRGVPHGDDIATQLEMGQKLLVAPGRGYVVSGTGEVRLLAAFDEDAAGDLLRAALANTGGGEAIVSWITSSQQWATRVCLEARLELSAGGAVCVDGDVGRFTPYLPSGAFL